MIRKILSAAAALVALSAVPAEAVCTQTNTLGTWKLYSAGASTSGAYWVKCKLIVGSTGNFGGTSSCSNSLGQSTAVTGHVKLTNPANCTFTGSVTYTPSGEVSTVNEATMSLDHQTVTGVGTFPNGEFVFTMVKL
jgi:hypothetical protein